MKPLSDLQRWVQAFVTSPELGLDMVEDAALLVRPSKTLTPAERVGIYRDMYLPRLIEALEDDYPGVLEYLGRERFGDAVSRYVQAHPSRTYTLNRLGDAFPSSLHGFAADLARLELAITQVFDEAECSVLKPADVAAIPGEAWETACLRPIAALRLLALDYPVSQYLDTRLKMRRRKTWVAVYRRDYSVERLQLNQPAFELLSHLIGGVAVAWAIADSRAGRQRIFEWFRDWTAAGLFQTIELR